MSDNGGTPLLTYRIYSNGGTGGTTFTQIVPDTAGIVSKYTITSGIQTDQVYQFKVAAVNALGDGALSEASPGIRAATVPSAPGAPTKISATTNNIVIQWSSPSYNGGSSLTKYSVYFATSSTGVYTLFSETSSASII